MPERVPESPEGSFETSARNARVVESALRRKTDELVSSFEKNDSLARSLVRILIDFVPIAGAGQKYLQAREEFSRFPQAEQLRSAARERCVIALMELVLDAATLGGSAAIPDELLTWLNRLKLLVHMRNAGKKLPVYAKVLDWIDIPGKIAQGLLTLPYAQKAIDQSLTVGKK